MQSLSRQHYNKALVMMLLSDLLCYSKRVIKEVQVRKKIVTVMQVVGICAIALGSYVVHFGHAQGGGMSAIIGGAVLISVGICLMVILTAGICGAINCSRVMLAIVSLHRAKINGTMIISHIILVLYCSTFSA